MPVNSQPLKPYIGLVFTTVKNRPIMSSFGSSARNLVEISENNQTSKIFSRNFENAANKPEFIRVAPVQQVKFFFSPPNFFAPPNFSVPTFSLSTLSSPFHPFLPLPPLPKPSRRVVNDEFCPILLPNRTTFCSKKRTLGCSPWSLDTSYPEKQVQLNCARIDPKT